MSSETHELVVRVRADTGDTAEELGDVNREFEEMEGDLDTMTGSLAAFRSAWLGAGVVFGAAFSGLVGTIASRMPIVQEQMSLMDQLLTTFALKLDNDVRPALSDTRDELIELNERAADTDNAWDDFLVTISSVDIASQIPAERATGRLGTIEDSVEDLEEAWEDALEAFNNFIDAITSDQPTTPGERVGGRGPGGTEPEGGGDRTPFFTRDPERETRQDEAGIVPFLPGSNRGGGGGGTSDVVESRTQINVNVDGNEVASAMDRNLGSTTSAVGRFNTIE